MNKLFNGSFTGTYEPRGNVADADCVALLEFGHRPETDHVGLPNIEIATRYHIDRQLHDIPIFASKSITAALHHIGSPVVPTAEFHGPSARGVLENTGTYGELEQLLFCMLTHQLERPAILTSRYNIGNLLFQALKIGIDPIVPVHLPGSFDPRSDQLWTQSRSKWRLGTYPRLALLRLKGH